MPTVSADELLAEYNKLGDFARSLPHVFLYVTDEAMHSTATGARGKHRCVVGRDGHALLMGSICAYLRAAALPVAPSEIDARSRAVHNAGARVLPAE